eukprot:TRINITY_DN19502_c0_g1_i1.p1 TRINITY_DN19502_c0_g1~~TRINITY_DN19502_c0_g1_i1.p1  ORF type:complete len:670 (+),score=133.31 TRINITY_DN19502_c0_g1_i1:302-2011(+)
MDLANIVICLSRISRLLDQKTPDCKHQAEAKHLASELLLCLTQSRPDLVASATSGHSLSNLAWAAARLQEHLPKADETEVSLPSAIVRTVISRVLLLGFETLPGRDLPVLLWALAWLQRMEAKLLSIQELQQVTSELNTHLVLRLSEVAPQGLAMLLWSFAALESSAASFRQRDKPEPSQGRSMLVHWSSYRAVAKEASLHMSSFSARELANMAWSMATVQYSMPGWLLQELPGKAAQMVPQECANTLWALASASHLESVEAATASFANWKPQELANATWALALSSGRRRTPPTANNPTLEALRCGALARVEELDCIELAMLAAALEPEPAGELAARISTHACKLLYEGRLQPDALVQLSERLPEMPAKLEKAWVELQHEVRRSLQAVPEKGPDHLPSLGLTSMGAAGSSQLLRQLGLLAVDDGAHVEELIPEPGETLCMMHYDLLLTVEEPATASEDVQPALRHLTLAEPGLLLSSGGRPDRQELLRSVTLRFSRDRDAEFLALSALVVRAQRAAGAGNWRLRGSVSLHISQAPCLSCIGAMRQFQHAFPDVRLTVAFDGSCQEDAKR